MGRTLGLSRVTIPPHVQLGLHHHAGNVQIAYIQRGTLTYTVGTVCEGRPGAAHQHPRVATVTAGHRARCSLASG